MGSPRNSEDTSVNVVGSNPIIPAWMQGDMPDPDAVVVEFQPLAGDEEVSEVSEVSEEESRTYKQLCFFILSVMLIYGAGDGSWQFVYELLPDLVSLDGIKYVAAYIGSNMLLGGVQMTGNFVGNLLPAKYEITSPWAAGDFASAFLTGALWNPFKDLGELADKDNPDSIKAITVSCATIAAGNFATLRIIKALSQRFESKEDKQETKKTKSASDITDTLGAVAFNLSRPLPLPGSGAGVQNVAGVVLAVVPTVAVAQIAHEVIDLCRNRRAKG